MPRPEWSLRVSNQELRQREKSDLRKPQSIPPLTLKDEDTEGLTSSEIRAAMAATAAIKSPRTPAGQRSQLRSPPGRSTSPTGSSRPRGLRRSPSEPMRAEIIPIGDAAGQFVPHANDTILFQGIIPQMGGAAYRPGQQGPGHYLYVVRNPQDQTMEADGPFPAPPGRVQPGIRFAERVASPPRYYAKKERDDSPRRNRQTYARSPSGRPVSPRSPNTGGSPGRSRSPRGQSEEPQQRLPHGWRAVRSPDGKLCYLHENSDRAEWTLPKDCRPSTRSEVTQEVLTGEPLPPGWRAIRLPNGLLCYIHNRSSQAAWSVPTRSQQYRQPQPVAARPPQSESDPQLMSPLASPTFDTQTTQQSIPGQELRLYFPLPKRDLDKREGNQAQMKSSFVSEGSSRRPGSPSPGGRQRRHSYTSGGPSNKIPSEARRAISPTTATSTPLSPLSGERTTSPKRRRPSTPPPVLPEKPRLPSPLWKRGIKCNSTGHKVPRGLSQGPYAPPVFDDRTEYRVEFSPNSVTTANYTLDDQQHYSSQVTSPPHTEYRCEYAGKYTDDSLPAGLPSCRQWYDNQESFGPPMSFDAAMADVTSRVMSFQ
eukprot:TRINITY_DN61408_c0_g1_i1.p1 TRINITY_DN61408_c0_g1~~TRINITY_DN61408_c0_g1_i1.p1  ORF type:complete len:593 (+),score=33.54 TRINITY_DN61408_c0_g1_i1:83-1861(+)